MGCQRKAPSPHASIPSGILLLNREIRASPDHGLVYSNVAIELAPGSDSSLIENDEAGAGLFDDDMEDDDMVSYMFATQRAASDPDLGARALVVGAIARPCGPNAETLLRSMAEPDVRLELEERMLGMEVSEMLQRRTLDVEFTNTPPPSCPRPSRVYRPGHLGLQVTPEQDVLHEEINAVREAPYYREWDR